jgi:ketosteroid isomerase-like protein
MNQTLKSFMDCINAHDIDGLSALMTDDHRFVDAHGNEITGKEKMTAGWAGYFEWFPDYHIEVTDVFENGNTFAMFGFAGGSFKGKESESWRLPAAWKAILTDGRVALWQVIADTKVPFDIIARNS